MMRRHLHALCSTFFRRNFERRLALAAFALCWLFSFAVRAAPQSKASGYGVVAMDLRPDRGEVPSHLCVISEVHGPRTRHKLSDFVGASQATQEEQEVPIHLDFWEAWPAEADLHCPHGGACLPKVRLPRGLSPDQLHVACVADSLFTEGTSPGETRLAFVLLEHLEGSPPMIDSLRLTGGVATVGIQLDLERVVVAARSVGGHFEAHQRSYHAEISARENKIVALPLTPRCAWIPIVTPALRLRESERYNLHLRTGNEPPAPTSCIGSLTGTTSARVFVPHADLEGSVSLDVRQSAASAASGSSYRGEWRGLWPEETLALEPTRVSFTWRAPECIYPRDVCPRASLASGASCTAVATGDHCRYTCEARLGGEGVNELALPAEVIFEKDAPSQRWSDTLRVPGQNLSSYVDIDRRYLIGDVSDWRLDVPGSRISSIDVLDAEGEVRRYPLLGRRLVRIRAPEASCEGIRYQIIGERKYEEAVAKVIDGKIKFGAPEKSVRALNFGFYLLQGGGPAWLLKEDSGDFRKLDPPSNYVGFMHLVANLRPSRPKLAPFSLELRFGGSVGQWGIYEGAVGNSVQNRHAVDRRVAWIRALVGAELQWDIVGPLNLGVGADVGGSWTTRPSDAAVNNATGGRDPVFMPFISGRFQLYSWVALVVQGRLGIGESTVRINQAVHNYRVLSTIGLLGVRVGLN
jgi:hypothetical protein